MKTARGQHITDRDYADMERQILKAFYEIIFKPTLAVIDDFNPQARGAVAQLRNASEDALREALSTGRVQYQAGIFSGQFSAGISAVLRDIGAKFDKRKKVYTLDAGRVPAWVKSEASNYQQKARQAHTLLRQKLDEIQENLARSVEIHAVDADKTIGHIDQGFQSVAKQLEVSVELSDDSKTRLAYEYSENMKLWINKFSRKEIAALRDTVEKNATAGYRFDSLIAGIKRRYGVTENKAKFLARQETGLFMAKFREERFKEAGIRKYKWSTSHDGRVRHDHRKLDGQIFLYDQPPVVDELTGHKGNPGQDYNCRCVDMPILEAVYA